MKHLKKCELFHCAVIASAAKIHMPCILLKGESLGTEVKEFAIQHLITHIDHGKSTLAEPHLEQTGSGREALTWKDESSTTWIWSATHHHQGAHAVTLVYRNDGEAHPLTLSIPRVHVDFNYEVSRSLAACEGAVLWW